MQIRAVVFDASGTLLDDIVTVWRANLAAYAALGFEGPGTLEDFRAAFRLPIAEFHRANGIPPDLLVEVDRRFRESYPRFAPDVKVFAEVEEVLTRLGRLEMVLGVASNIPSLFLREHLNKLGIDGYFDIVTGQEDCDEQKPSPKPILATVVKLGVRPEETVYVGDMEEDIIAGRRAGTMTAAIVRDEGYHPLWRLQRQSPDFLITNLSELLPACCGAESGGYESPST
jgi:HAD superfamily hydrolase (TIGR01549 family)